MKIGITINQSWNIYNFRKGLIQSFLDNGHEVIAIAPKDKYADKLMALGCQFVDVPMESKGTNPFKDFMLIRKLYKVYKEQKLDVVLHYTIKPNIYGTISARWAGIPCINNVTGLGTVFIHPNKISSKIARALYKHAFKSPKTIFFQNDEDKKLFIERKLVKEAQAAVLPGSGIDLEHFKPVNAKERNKPFIFLVIARVLYDKGIMEYVEAIKSLRAKGVNARFQLLGRINETKGLGVPEEQVNEWVKEGIIEYLGTVDDVRPVIAAADCMVLPSYREGTPRTLLEAASMGMPIVTTDVPGCKETVIDGYNGYLCKVKSGQDLADKMEKVYMLSDSDLVEMGKNSREFALKKFDQNIVINMYYSALGGHFEKVVEPTK